jgi:LmbE family N-acetylglucosaminyl deacetylase
MEPRWLIRPGDVVFEGRRILVFGPHPDDFDVIAVTLRRAAWNGASIDLAVMTTGANGVDDEDFPGLDRAGKAELRQSEQVASCAAFGLPRARQHYLRLDEGPTGELTVDARSLGIVHELLSRRVPDLVVLPHPNDPNRAHQRTFLLVRQALEASRSGAILLLNCDPKTLEIRLDLGVTFNAAEAEWKGSLLRQHDSQQRRNMRTRGRGLDTRILELNAGLARRIGSAAYAEAFEVRSPTADQVLHWRP